MQGCLGCNPFTLHYQPRRYYEPTCIRHISGGQVAHDFRYRNHDCNLVGYRQNSAEESSSLLPHNSRGTDRCEHNSNIGHQ